MAIKVKHNDEVIEVTADSLELPDGYGLITPDSVPKGYFTQEALDKTIQERLNRDREKAKDRFLNDDDFNKQILAKHNISLDKDGKPSGLKPDFDPEEWKKSKVKEITEPYEQKLQERDQKLNSFKKGLVKAELMKSASNLFQEQYLRSFTSDDDPFVVKQFADRFDVDDNGNVLQKDKDGGFYVNNDGSHVTPSKFFEMNKDSFGDMIRDNRQRGSGLNAGGAGKRKWTEEEVKKLTDKEFEENRKEILESLAQ